MVGSVGSWVSGWLGRWVVGWLVGWVGKLRIKSISAQLSYASTETGLSLAITEQKIKLKLKLATPLHFNQVTYK